LIYFIHNEEIVKKSCSYGNKKTLYCYESYRK
jgi:hypothetical protein